MAVSPFVYRQAEADDMRVSKVKTLIPAPEAVTYEIVPNVSSIRADGEGTVLTDVILLSAYRREGDSRTSCPLMVSDGTSYYWVQYKIDNGNWTACSSMSVQQGQMSVYAYGVPHAAVLLISSGIRFRLLYGTGTANDTILTETGALQVVRDGADGVDGANGADGTNAITYEIIPDVASISADADGNIRTGAIGLSAYRTEDGIRSSCSLGVSQAAVRYWVQYKVDNGSWTACSMVRVTIGLVSTMIYGVPASAVATVTSGIRFRLLHGTGTANDTVLTETGAMQVVRDGQTGSQGKTGRFYYYDGYFDDDKEYTADDYQAPYVAFDYEDTMTVEGVQTQVVVTGYYMLVAATNIQNNVYVAPRTQGATGIWQRMTSDHKFLIVQAFFTEFAMLGSAVICGDWMISQHGTINGAASVAYRNFDATDPMGIVSGHFAPNYAVDFLAGKVYMNDAFVRGTVKTLSFQTAFADITPLANSSIYPTFVVGVDLTVGNDNINGIWNFKCSENEVFLPTNIYAHWGQRVILYNPNLANGGGGETIVHSGEYEVDENEMETLTYREIRGVGMSINNNNNNYHNPMEPTMLNQYDSVGEIIFANGVLELMCVPPPNNLPSGDTTQCEWCVVNIGTNVFKPRRYQDII